MIKKQKTPDDSFVNFASRGNKSNVTLIEKIKKI
jgi:hypothetical protein